MNFTDTMAIYDKHWNQTYAPGSADRLEQVEISNRVANVFVPLGLAVAEEQPGTRKSKYIANPMLTFAKELNDLYVKRGFGGSHIEELNTLAATLRSGVVVV